MASLIYDLGMEKILDGSIDLDTDNLKLALVDVADYTVNGATDEFIDILSASADVARSGNLASVTVTGGILDAADLAPAFTSVTDDASEALILYKDSGADATSPVIAYIDGFSVTPDGGNINVTFDGGAAKIIDFNG